MASHLIRKRLTLAGVILAAVLAAGSAAQAQGTKPPPVAKPDLFEPEPTRIGQINLPSTHFTLIPLGRRNALFAWGGIHEGDAARLEAAIAAAVPIEEVRLFSPGGDLEEGLEMGRVIHRHHLTTHVTHGMQCVSACNFVFLGGTVRIIDADAVFKVHMFATTNLALRVLSEVMRAPKTFEDYNRLYHDHPVDEDEWKRWNADHQNAQLSVPLFLQHSIVNEKILDIQQELRADRRRDRALFVGNVDFAEVPHAVRQHPERVGACADA